MILFICTLWITYLHAAGMRGYANMLAFWLALALVANFLVRPEVDDD